MLYEVITVAFDINKFFIELESVTSRNVPMPNILVSDRAQILMPYHILFDELEEKRLGSKSFGSTKSGIAPFYSDKYLKIGVQVGEMFDDEILMERLVKVCEIVITSYSIHYTKLYDCCVI